MKGILNTDVSTSDGKTFLVGTSVEIVNGWCGCDGNFYQCEFLNGIQITINANNIDITDHSPYINWEQRRYELAKAAMQGILSDEGEVNFSCSDAEYKENEKHTVPKAVARYAIACADALINELKGE